MMLNSDYTKNGTMPIKQENHLLRNQDYDQQTSIYDDLTNFAIGAYKYDLDDDSYGFGDDEEDFFTPRNKGGRKQVKVGTTKRNARERNRVRYINSCFEVLREHIPFELVNEKKHRKLSKVETLKYATLYIKQLGELLGNNEDNNSSMEIVTSSPTTPSYEQPRKRIRSEEQTTTTTTTTSKNVVKNDTNNNLVVNNININIYDNRFVAMSSSSSTNVNSYPMSNSCTLESYPYSPTTSTSSSSSSSSSSSYYSPKYIDNYAFESTSAGYNFYSNCCQPSIAHHNNSHRMNFVDSRYFNHGTGVLN